MATTIDMQGLEGLSPRTILDVGCIDQAEARQFLAENAIELALDRRSPEQFCAELALYTALLGDQEVLEYEEGRSTRPSNPNYVPVLGARTEALPRDQAENMTMSASKQRRKL